MQAFSGACWVTQPELPCQPLYEGKQTSSISISGRMPHLALSMTSCHVPCLHGTTLHPGMWNDERLMRFLGQTNAEALWRGGVAMKVAALTAIWCYVEEYTYTLWPSILHARSRCFSLESSKQRRLDLFVQMILDLHTDPCARIKITAQMEQ